jgi:hypothetical protein
MILYIILHNLYPKLRYNPSIHYAAVKALRMARDTFTTNIKSIDFDLHFNTCEINIGFTAEAEELLSILSGVFSYTFKRPIFAKRILNPKPNWELYKYHTALEVYADEVSDRMDSSLLITTPIKPFKEMPEEFRVGTLLHDQ